jgi:hypothetical protein
MEIIGKRFKQVVRHGPVWNYLFDFNGNRLSFKHSNNDRQPTVTLGFSQNQGERTGL